MHFGVDISSNNPHPINWPAAYADLKARGGGAQPFAIVKATQGTGYVNDFFAEDVHAATTAGFAVGAYLMDQGNDDVAAEEALFRRIAGGLPQFDDDELPMGNAQYAAHCAELLAQAPSAGDYLNQSEEDEGFPLSTVPWEANYDGQPGVTHRVVLIHQFSDSGTVNGIGGRVDLNAWLGTDAQFDRVFHLVITPPTPPEDWFTMATLQDLETAVRAVLNEGTASGQIDWANTEKAILGTAQGLINDMNALSAAVRALPGEIVEALRSAGALMDPPPAANGTPAASA